MLNKMLKLYYYLLPYYCHVLNKDRLTKTVFKDALHKTLTTPITPHPPPTPFPPKKNIIVTFRVFILLKKKKVKLDQFKHKFNILQFY